jgi:vacuolar protein sorting-associated protein 18
MLSSDPSLAPGIYHGTLNFESNSDDLIDGAQLLPYPLFPPPSPSSPSVDATTPEIPISIALTEFHFILIYKDRIAAVCNLDEKLTYEERLPLVGSTAISISQ